MLREEVIVGSWGITNINVEETYIEFHVCGFLYQGKVRLTLFEHGYRINLDNGTLFDCSLDELVKTLDSIIEWSSDYESNLINWLTDN